MSEVEKLVERLNGEISRTIGHLKEVPDATSETYAIIFCLEGIGWEVSATLQSQARRVEELEEQTGYLLGAIGALVDEYEKDDHCSYKRINQLIEAANTTARFARSVLLSEGEKKAYWAQETEAFDREVAALSTPPRTEGEGDE